MKSKKGFTLIELLVVIAIIAVLLAILLPSLKKAKELAKRVIEMNGVRQIGIGINLYSTANDNKIMPYMVDSTTKADAPGDWEAHKGVIVYFGGTDASGKLIASHLALLYEGGYLEDPEIFYCPSQPRNIDYPIPYYYDFYTKNGTIEWGSEVMPIASGGHIHVRTSYNYYTYKEKKLSKINSYKAIVFDNIQEWEVVPHRKSSSSTAKPQGLAALYADGHAAFVTKAELFTSYTWNGLDSDNGIDYDGPGNDNVAFGRIMKVLEGN